MMAMGCDSVIDRWETGSMPVDLTAAPQTILVGLDGSEMSHRAIAYAGLLANAFDAEVVAVHAVGMLTILDGETLPSDHVRDRLEAAVDEWAAPLRDAGCSYRVALEDGPPGLVLMRMIERTGAGLVVLGTRGIGSADGVVLGSTSHHLVQHSPVPVVVTH
jgi:nucleotide-binding universal stress UspA family protein